MSRSRHASRPVPPPAPHRLRGTEAVVVIVIVLTATALYASPGPDAQRLDLTTVLQLVAGAALIGMGVVATLRFMRRAHLSALRLV
ncbi:hypothetical protein GCM10010387_01360 [Streptomyces inusitatus]|uniref:Uncharacterized protein n=1 Tax=Streptomyces inusitatus TaxID=68221 RepID=A0A918PJN0_9ACTN|nr:hypothetical protein [Streptomyces inusitatus]GGZ13109.1 hypothetical protein GCM10010387_01360 [Streptomyces inusitatus]